MKRKLSIHEALEMAALVFIMNTKKEPALILAEQAGLLQIDGLFKDKESENSLPKKPVPEKNVLEKNAPEKNLFGNNVPENLSEQSVQKKELEEKFLWEWYAFVHASVSFALSVHGPAVLFVEYLRGTRQLLESLGYSSEKLDSFVDEALLAYSAPLLEGREKECPSIFFQKLFQKNIQDISKQAVVLISGAMAMLLCACHDTFEKFEYDVE